MFRNEIGPVRADYASGDARADDGGTRGPLGTRLNDRRRLVDALRRSCLEQGWDVCALARRAGVSRTTLHHLLTGTTRQPHLATLGRIANALGVRFQAVDVAGAKGSAGERGAAEFGEVRPAILADGAFDRMTNPAVEQARRTRPALFAGWSREEWDELYSTFGVGGNLTAEGAAECARAINDRRETTRQLHLILETHLADVASRFIETLYEMVRPAAVCESFSGEARTQRSAPDGPAGDSAGGHRTGNG